MIRTSPESDAGPLEPAPAPRRAFRRALAVTVAVLVIVVAGSGFVSLAQGPKLTQAQVDAAAVVENPGQQLRLFTDQAVAQIKADQVRVTPATPFTVSSSGTVIAIQFTDRLAYSADYQVRISRVSSVYRASDSTLQTRFRTAGAQISTLIRSPGADDQLVRASLDSAGRTVVYHSPRIDAYASVGSDLMIVSDDGHSSAMALVAPDGTVDHLPVPDGGMIRGFGVDAPTGIVFFGMARTPDEPQSLYSLRLSGSQLPVPLPGPDRHQLVARDWVLDPSAPVVLARATTGALIRADLAIGGRTVDVPRPSGAERALLDTVEGAAAGRRVALPGGAVALADPRQLTVGDRVLFRAPAGSGIVGLGSSPNGQYLTVVTAANGSPLDGYPIDPQPRQPTTLIVDVASGGVVASFAGSLLEW